jgi:flagellar biosynthesis/type III secretory pathway ATPase
LGFGNPKLLLAAGLGFGNPKLLLAAGAKRLLVVAAFSREAQFRRVVAAFSSRHIAHANCDVHCLVVLASLTKAIREVKKKGSIDPKV